MVTEFRCVLCRGRTFTVFTDSVLLCTTCNKHYHVSKKELCTDLRIRSCDRHFCKGRFGRIGRV